MSTQIKSECDYRVIRKSVLWWPGAIIALKCINKKCRNAYYEAPTRIMLAVEYYKRILSSWQIVDWFMVRLFQLHIRLLAGPIQITRLCCTYLSISASFSGQFPEGTLLWNGNAVCVGMKIWDRQQTSIVAISCYSYRFPTANRPSGCVPLLCQCATNIKCGKKWANHFRIRANKKSAVKFCVSKRARKNNQEEPAHWWAAETLWRMMSRGRWLVGLNATRARRFLWPTSWIAPKLDEKFLAVQFCTQKEPSPNMRPMWVVSYQRI